MPDKPQRLKTVLVDLDGQPMPDWVRQGLEREGIELSIRNSKSYRELAAEGAEAEVIWLFGGSRILWEGDLSEFANCWAILRTGSGTDNVPVDVATERRILVANTPAAFSDGVSDHVIALIFAAARRIGELDRSMRRGEWIQPTATPISSVQGRTLGLVGFGHIGRELARKLSGFSMNILAYDPYVDAGTLAQLGVKPASLDRVLSDSDYISLHCPLTAETRHLIASNQFRLMKKSAIFINTSRGPVVDESALVRALSEGRIAAAGLDVFEDEPPKRDNPLLKMENVVLTPHGAGYAVNGVELRWRLSLETLAALAHRRWPASCVNRAVTPRHELSAG